MSRFKTGKERRKRRRAYKRKVAREQKLAASAESSAVRDVQRTTADAHHA